MSKINLENLGAVVLSAGKGTRLNCIDKPKAMLEVAGKPMIYYIIETLKKLGLSPEQICLVVGFKKEKIVDYFGSEVSYAFQEEQLGTAHATYVGVKVLEENIKYVLVLGGDDSLFYKVDTLKDLVGKHLNSGAVLTLLTSEVVDNLQYHQYGRVLKKGDRFEIKEKESLSDEDKKIKEISTGTFVFERDWFENNYQKIGAIPGLGEYGLPSLVDIANRQNEKTNLVELKNKTEWLGINTAEELQKANDLKKYE